MPLTQDLLSPVPGANPSGNSLRYAPVFDKIKEARREEDESPQGEWVRERKKADYRLSLALCSDALKKCKDLQIAAWTVEAALKLEGLAGLREGIDLLRGLLENFWDTLYPEVEDGDVELRAAPLEWVGTKLTNHLLTISLTSNHFDWLAYKESRAVGYESAATDDTKRQDRERAIAEDKLTAEMFDEAVAATSRSFYEAKLAEADACLAAVAALNETAESTFGEFRPTFAPLRESLEDLRQTINILLQKKPTQDAKESPSTSQIAVAETTTDSQEVVANEPPALDAPEEVAAQEASLSRGVIESEEDAMDCVIRAANYLRREKPYSPVSYLLLRALRWGELREVGELDVSRLEAPATETRKLLRKHLQNGEWQELLEANEAAMATPCGRGWLDLQRYAVKATEQLGESYAPISAAIMSALRGLISDYPQLAGAALDDETPAANPETQAWLAEEGGVPDKRAHQTPSLEQELSPTIPDEGNVDIYEQAKSLADSGRAEEAIAMLEREIAKEKSGRGRFQRKLQLAQICIGAGYIGVAYPILDALSSEIDQRSLEEWEGADVVLNALRLLYVCLEKLKRNPEQREKIYARICRLGPLEALELAR